MAAYGRRATLALALLIGFAGEAAAEVGLEFGVEDFRWREFDAGERLLEETGPRYRIGGYLRHPIGAAGEDLLELRGGLYFGSVDYDGQACEVLNPNNCVPFQTDTEYAGAFVEALLTRRLDRFSDAEVFIGGGVDAWERDIEGRDNVAGAVEDWTVFYLLVGGGTYWTRTAVRYHARAGIKYPFYTHEVPDSYAVTLQPKGRLSYFARFTADFLNGGQPRWGVGLYYDSYRFDESDLEDIGGGVGVFQPESHQDLIGLYAAVYFR